MKAGIIGYGAYIPWRRIKVEEIARVWGKNGKQISSGLNVQEKSVAAFDEDTCTLSIEAARRAIADFEINPKRIQAIYVGSESHPYAVNPTSSIVGDALNTGNNYFAVDMEFACKAGTAGMQVCYAQVLAGLIDVGLAIGADTAQGKPNDALEFTAGSGAGAILIGSNEKEIIAEINATCSFTTDTPDFWRRAKALFEKTGMSVKDFDYAVFHQPNGKFPLRAADILGIPREKIKQGLITPFIGNTYSGATPIGLCSVLDKARPGEKILAVSYGSGAGSDAFALTVTKNIEKRRAKIPVMEQIEKKKHVDYALYLKHRRKIKSL